MPPKKRRKPDDIIEEIIALFIQLEDLFEQLLAEQLADIASIAESVDSSLLFVDKTEAVLVLQDAVESTIAEAEDKIQELSDTVIEQTYESPTFSAYYESNERSAEVEQAIKDEADAIVRDLDERLENLSGTTVITPQYVEAIDNAVRAMQQGDKGFYDVTQDVISEFGGNGIKVQYASGTTRRLDSAVRMNVVGAYRNMAYSAADKIGEEIGCDAVEISAHPMSAPDHEPVQGRVFPKEEFNNMQSGLASKDINGTTYSGFGRKIMQWNCRHFVSPFSTKWSKRRYTDEQLKQWQEENASGVDLAGKHYTLYQVTQLQRGLETRIRQLRGKAVMAEKTNDHEAQVKYQRKINESLTQYRVISDKAGIRPDYKRTDVQGFRNIRV